jgi:hypothetical protein
VSRRIFLVRGARSPGGGGTGCCSGDVKPFDEGGDSCHAAPRDEVGTLYLALRAALPDDVTVEVVSPSNWMWLLPALFTDGRRRGLRGAELRRSVHAGMAVSSLVVDGHVLFSGRLPPAAEAVAAVRRELALR